MPITMEPHSGPSLVGMLKQAWEAMKAPGKAYNEGMTPDEMIKAGNDFAMTMGTGGSLVPKPGNALGTFGGKLAKTADLEKLAQAEKFEKAGLNADVIWKATGWGRGKDGKWRFEINDQKAQFTDTDLKPNWGIVGQGANYPLYDDIPKLAKEVYSHDDLYAAYPQLKETKVIPEHRSLGVSYGGKVGIDDRMIPEKMNSTMLHELQHEVQKIEGFAKGSSPDSSASTIISELGLEHPISKSIIEKTKGNAMRELTDLERKLYRHSAGETESRNVQARMAFNKLKRALNPPWATEDVPRNLQLPFGYK